MQNTKIAQLQISNTKCASQSKGLVAKENNMPEPIQSRKFNQTWTWEIKNLCKDTQTKRSNKNRGPIKRQGIQSPKANAVDAETLEDVRIGNSRHRKEAVKTDTLRFWQKCKELSFRGCIHSHNAGWIFQYILVCSKKRSIFKTESLKTGSRADRIPDFERHWFRRLKIEHISPRPSPLYVGFYMQKP